MKGLKLANVLRMRKNCCCCLVTQSCQTLCDPMDLARQAPLSMGFSRKEYWSGVLFLPPGYLPNPGIEPVSSALAGGFFTAKPPYIYTVPKLALCRGFIWSSVLVSLILVILPSLTRVMRVRSIKDPVIWWTGTKGLALKLVRSPIQLKLFRVDCCWMWERRLSWALICWLGPAISSFFPAHFFQVGKRPKVNCFPFFFFPGTVSLERLTPPFFPFSIIEARSLSFSH